MFTGIIEEKNIVVSHEEGDEVTRLVVKIPSGWKLKLGQSIAVNGTCLTVVGFNDETFTVELMRETLNKTTFGKYIPESVNLERAMLPSDRFEGHIVQGHVDMVGEVTGVEKGKETMGLTISHRKTHSNLIVEKGSITVDGVSLTVVNPRESEFSVALIPYTIKETTLGLLKRGDFVNLEFDIIGKYIIKNN